jgi:WD40 repeat protein
MFHFDVCGFNETKSFTSHDLSLEDVMIEFEGESSIWTGALDGSISVLTTENDGNRVALSEKLAILSTPHSSPITKICTCPEYVAIGESRGLVSLWRRNTLIRLISHPGPVVDLAWSVSSPDILAIAGGKTVNFYSVFQGKVTGQINTENEICRIVWSINTSEIVISTDSLDENLSLCSYPEIKIQNCWVGHDFSPIFLGLCGNGSSLISASSDEFIKVKEVSLTESFGIFSHPKRGRTLYFNVFVKT